MAIDTRKVIVAAVEAALDDVMSAAKPEKRKRLSAGRAFLLGASVVTAARLASGSRGRQLLDSVQDRLAGFEERYLSEDDADDEDGEEEWDGEEWEEEPRRNTPKAAEFSRRPPGCRTSAPCARGRTPPSRRA